MLPEHRFQGTMSADFLLIRQTLLNFDELQQLVAEAVAGCTVTHTPDRLQVLDLGCGDGITSAAILARRGDATVTALDSEAGMVDQATAHLAEPIRQGRCRVVLHDALDYLRQQPEAAYDVVASALALHNLHRHYRRLLHAEIFRVLRPGGRFVNADKYAASDDQRFGRLDATLGRFFDAFVPLGKLDLLRASVLHEVADEAPDRVMWEDDAVRELRALGFGPIEVQSRLPMAAVLVALR